MSNNKSGNESRTDIPIVFVDDVCSNVASIRNHLRAQKFCNPLYESRNGHDAVETLGQLTKANGAIPAALMLVRLNPHDANCLEFLENSKGDPAIQATRVFVYSETSAAIDIKDACRRHAVGYIEKRNNSGFFEKIAELLGTYARIVVFPDTSCP